MSAEAEDRDRVVVVFGIGGADGWCELSHCPMHAHGPYTEAEAREAADRMPQWMQPHILIIDAHNDACLRGERHG